MTTRDHGMRFLTEDGAQGLVEYALILGIIAIAVIIAMGSMRGQLGNLFSSISNSVHDSPCHGPDQVGSSP